MVDVLPTDRRDTSQQAQQPEPDKPRTAYLTKYEPGLWARQLSRYNC